ncbi:PDZ domain-containing protein [Chitinophaga eiseniae]|uniref:hypothetical protein n=1 Tax=Chitinophaga eiseniae TaxID=634771 RepID=UPI001178AE48|nr:hypothetical protein [Chitinophaga eiseniae]
MSSQIHISPNDGTNSLLSSAGLKTGDVTRMADGRSVKSVSQLLGIVKEVSWKCQLRLSVIRQQQPVEVVLRLK